MEAYPLHAVDFGQPLHKFGEALLPAGEVGAISREVLSDDIELLHTLFHQFAHLQLDLLDGARLMVAGDERDGTEGAVAVASFGYFKICVVRGSGERAAVAHRSRMAPGEVVGERGPVEFAVEAVYLGDLLLELLAVALREASHHIDFLDQAAVFGIDKPHDGVDALLLGVADEATGVDHRYL